MSIDFYMDTKSFCNSNMSEKESNIDYEDSNQINNLDFEMDDIYDELYIESEKNSHKFTEELVDIEIDDCDYSEDDLLI